MTLVTAFGTLSPFNIGGPVRPFMEGTRDQR
jgi:hypothetical protein